MNVRTVVAFTVSIIALHTVPAHAQVVTFDDLPANAIFLSQGYAGFSWIGEGDASGNPFTSWLLSSLESYPGASYPFVHKPVSGSQNAWTNASSAGVIARAAPFDFLSVWMAGTDLRGDPNETLHGFADGVEIYTRSVALDPDLAMRRYDFNFVGVDSVRFDGRNHAGNLVVDDIAYATTVAPTPEPASVLLLGTGMCGVFGVACRRRQRAIWTKPRYM